MEVPENWYSQPKDRIIGMKVNYSKKKFLKVVLSCVVRFWMYENYQTTGRALFSMQILTQKKEIVRDQFW